MNRRAFVIGLGATVGAGVGTGCVGPPWSGASTRGDDPAIEVGETAAVGDRTVRVSDARLAEAVLLDHEQFLSVERREGWQFVLADVNTGATTDPLVDFEFALVVDGETHRAGFEPTTVRGDETIGLPVPVAEATRAELVVEYGGESATWRLASDLAARFDRVPAFAVREARIEATDGGIAIVLAVENAGDRDGTFRALAAPTNVADVEHPVTFDVPPGETVVRERSLDEREDVGSVRIVSEWSADSRRFEYG